MGDVNEVCSHCTGPLGNHGTSYKSRPAPASPSCRPSAPLVPPPLPVGYHCWTASPLPQQHAEPGQRRLIPTGRLRLPIRALDTWPRSRTQGPSCPCCRLGRECTAKGGAPVGLQCTSDPQMPCDQPRHRVTHRVEFGQLTVFFTSTSTSSGPTWGTGSLLSAHEAPVS